MAATTATLVASESGKEVEAGGATTAITVAYPGQENTAATIRKITALPRNRLRNRTRNAMPADSPSVTMTTQRTLGRTSPRKRGKC